MWKVLAWLLLLAIAGRALHVIFVGFSDPTVPSNVRVGHEFGGALFVFVIGAVGAGVVAFAKRKSADRFAGLATGGVLIVAVTILLMYHQHKQWLADDALFWRPW